MIVIRDIKYSEKVRNQYVNFEKKKTLIVKREGMIPKKASKEDWQGVIDEITGKIKNIVGENTISYLESNFILTNPVTLTKPSFNNVRYEAVFYI